MFILIIAIEVIHYDLIRVIRVHTETSKHISLEVLRLLLKLLILHILINGLALLIQILLFYHMNGFNYILSVLPHVTFVHVVH